jgi:energy-coupling factor transport system ATP-binding protein
MLDPVGRLELIETIKALNRTKGLTVLSITHDLEEVVNADRAIVLNMGEIIFNGKPNELFTNSKIVENASLDLPNIYKLRKLLESKKIKLNKDFYELESLVEELWASYSKM